jgi:hypothetical protein
VAAPSMVQPLLSLKENTTPHPANKNKFSKADIRHNNFLLGKLFACYKFLHP